MAKNKVVYKVIQSNTRISFTVHSDNKYCIHYKLNTIVKAIKGTLGIMCFEGKKFAEKFIKEYSFLDLEIVEVRPIGKASYPTEISHSVKESCLNNFYKVDFKYFSILTPPKGTVCYKSVEVLT